MQHRAMLVELILERLTSLMTTASMLSLKPIVLFDRSSESTLTSSSANRDFKFKFSSDNLHISCLHLFIICVCSESLLIKTAISDSILSLNMRNCFSVMPNLAWGRAVNSLGRECIGIIISHQNIRILKRSFYLYWGCSST